MAAPNLPRPAPPSAQAPAAPDIVVVGGGMAGVMAALAAKTGRNRVLLIEPSNVLGGQGTAGGVAGFCGDSKRVNGEFATLVGRLAAHGLIEPYRPNEDRRAYDLEWCAFFLQEMVVERGIEVLLLSRVIAAQADGGMVTELTVSTSGGMLTLAPRFVIDASGACVVPWLTGFPFMHEGANRQLPMSLYFTLWDTGKNVTPVLPPGCPRWTHDDEIPMTSLHRFSSGKVEVKMKVVGFDAADGRDRSAAEIFARRQMHALIHYLQTVGYRDRKLDTHVLASVSRGIGIREERRIVGEHVLTEAEARRAVIFSDAVAVNTYHIDFHWPDRAQRAGTGITDMLDPHHLPLRMMIPKGARNLLVAGRGASGDQTAMSAFRVMAVVAQLGYAAGHAARQCVEEGVTLERIDVPRLQAAIETGGQSLNLSDYGEYLRWDRLVDETVQVGVSASALALSALRNGCFHVAWRDPAGAWLAMERREKRWSALEVGAAGAVQVAQGHGSDLGLRLADGTLVRLRGDAARQTLGVALSENDGATWSALRDLLGNVNLAVRPAAVATAVGLALVFLDRQGQLRFWHGSKERLAEGPPVPSAVRLNAPPDHVEEADALRA